MSEKREIPAIMENMMEEKREQFVRQNLMSDQFLNYIHENTEPFETMMTYYRCAIMEVETKFKVLNEEFSLEYDRNPIENINSRVKSMESLMKKIRDRNIPLTLESIEQNITDIAGVRVICSFTQDIYMIADWLTKQDDIMLLEVKDYIKNPKPSGYRSLHLIVEIPIFLAQEKRPMKVEVQLRTIAMDFWASLEHKLRYKKTIPEDKAQELAARLYKCAETSAALDAEMQDIRNEIGSENAAKQEKAEKAMFALPMINRKRRNEK